MNEMTHDRCSELLGAYASGGLDDRARVEVEAHLAGCPACASELAALEALAMPGLVPLTGPEREQLSAGVRQALAPPARPGWAERWGRRVAPALGAAALLAIGVVALVSLTGESEDSPAAGGGSGGDNSSADTAELAPAEESDADTFGKQAAPGGGATEEVAGTTADSSATSIAMRPATSTVVSTTGFASQGLDVATLIPPGLDRQMIKNSSVDSLVSTAPDAALGDVIRRCSERVVSSSAVSLVPTSATYFPSDDVLVMSFVWVDDTTGALNFEIRGWLGGRCDGVTPIYRRGLVGE